MNCVYRDTEHKYTVNTKDKADVRLQTHSQRLSDVPVYERKSGEYRPCLFVCVAQGGALFCASLKASTRMLILVFACASFSFKRKRPLIVKENILLIVACARDEDHSVSGLFHPCLELLLHIEAGICY